MSAGVRAASADDFPSLEPMLPAFLGPPYKRRRFERALIAGEVVVVQDGGEIVAFLWTNEFFGHAFVNVIAVAPQCRRRGYAGLLLAHAEAAAPTDRVFSSTNASNTPMQAVFERYGWKRCGEIDEFDPGDPELVYVKKTPGRSGGSDRGTR